MNLVEFYEEWLKSMKLGVDEEGGLYVKSKSRGKMPLLQDGIKMYLPTVKNVRNALEPDENGDLVLTKFLFNPLQESVYRGENKSLLRMRKHLDRITSNSFMIACEILIRILADKEIDIEDLKLIKIIEELKKYKSTGLKNIVDEDTAKNIFKIYRNIASGPENGLPVHTYLKRGGKVDGEKVNRIGVVTFPLLEVFDKATVKEEVYGVKLRNKDISAYKVLYKVTFDDCEYDTLLNGISFKSKDNYSPGSDIVLQMYDYLAVKINSFIDAILTVGKYKEELEDAKLELLSVDFSDLPKLFKKLSVEVDKVPDKDSLTSAGEQDNKNRIFEGVSKTDAFGDKNSMSGFLNEKGNFREEVVDKETSAMNAILGKRNEPQSNTFASQSFNNGNSLFGNNSGGNNLFSSNINNNNGSLFGNSNAGNTVFNTPNVTSVLNNF